MKVAIVEFALSSRIPTGIRMRNHGCLDKSDRTSPSTGRIYLILILSFPEYSQIVSALRGIQAEIDVRMGLIPRELNKVVP